MRIPVLVVLAALTTSCSSALECGPTATDHCLADVSIASALAGDWAQLHPANGGSVLMSLAANGAQLTGTGSFIATGSAGGSIQIAGTVSWQDAVSSPGGVMPAGPVSVLTFTFKDGSTARLDQAKLVSPDTLSGVLTFSGSPSVSYGVAFARTVIFQVLTDRASGARR